MTVDLQQNQKSGNQNRAMKEGGSSGAWLDDGFVRLTPVYGGQSLEIALNADGEHFPG
jgi:hypothetical protein